jgi:adenylate cyclase
MQILRHDAAAKTRQRLLPGLLMVMLGAVVHFLPATALLDLKLLDTGFSVLRRIAAKPAPVSPVLIAADEATLAAFPEPIALWHRYLGTILAGLARAQPSSVGIDIELPQRSQDQIQPGLDLALAEGMQLIKAAAPLVIARGVDELGRVKPVHFPFLAIAGEGGSGLAVWPLDTDDVVRRFDERQGEAGARVPTFAGELARRLGKEPTPGLIDFALGNAFSYVPMHRVWAWMRAGDDARMRAEFGGRVVLIGGVLPFSDRHRQPVNLAGWEEADRAAPGLLLHAQALRSMLGPGLVKPASAAWTVAAVLCAAVLWFAFAHIGAGLALAATYVVGLAITALWLLHAGTHLPIATALLTALGVGASRLAYDAWHNHRERRRLRQAFDGYVSPNVMQLILRGELHSQVGTGRRKLCVLFADIRDFTRLSERTAPEDVVALLNRYFERMTKVIHRHEGTVDNFRGDGIMCFFGAPRQTDRPCHDGFLAATGMLAEIEDLNAQLAAEGRAPILMGIALAYGEAVVGRIGAVNRHDYTAIGDVANVSARLEALTKEFGYPLVVTGAVAEALVEVARFDDLGEAAVKGHASVRACGWPPRQASRDARATSEASRGLAA